MGRISLETIGTIERRLEWQNSKTGKAETIFDWQIADIAGPIIVLGDPGIGKSTVTRNLGTKPGNVYVSAGTFVRSKTAEKFKPVAGCRLIIDGLDEIASNSPSGGIDAILSQLSGICNPPFILSSRAADWQGSSARRKIEDDYGEAISILHLMPFDSADAKQFLTISFPDIDGEYVLNHLASKGLDEIYRNPLTLKMMGDVARSQASLPETRVGLLETACRVMLHEANDHHSHVAHSVLEEEILLAAGGICAALLLCDRSGVFSGPERVTPDDYLPLTEISKLTYADAAKEALKTRLFLSQGEFSFAESHRVLAEYLAARWLGHCVEKGASESRVRSLLIHNDGVPTSLRGMNAWLAHFSETMAPKSIDADPYAVLRYGNAESLPLHQAKALLSALRTLSREDPHFRSEDWSRHPAAGLMRRELKAEILEIIADDRTPAHLSLLVLEAVAGTTIASEIVPTLEAIVADPNRTFGVRSRAADAIPTNLEPSVEKLISKLLKMGDSESQRLAFELAFNSDAPATNVVLMVEAMLAHSGVSVSLVPKTSRDVMAYVPRNFFQSLSQNDLVGFLDILSNYVELVTDRNTPTMDEIGDVARLAFLVIYGTRMELDAAQVWQWLRWLQDSVGYDVEARNEMRSVFDADIKLRQAVQAAALSNVPFDELRNAAFELGDACWSLMPNDEDIIVMINDLRPADETTESLARLRELVLIARRKDGLPEIVRSAAEKFASSQPDFLTELREFSKPIVHQHEQRQRIRTAELDADRGRRYQEIRAQHQENFTEIAEGHFKYLKQVARVYLGRFPQGFNKELPPERKVEAFLGENLAEVALNGLVAALHRNDLPTDVEIAVSHAEGKEWNFESVLVCGVAEMVRRGIGLNEIPVETLKASYMAWRRHQDSNIVGGIEIGDALERHVLNNEINAERFFRTSIEPQLAKGVANPYDLYQLTHGKRWTQLSSRLCVDWLVQFDSLPKDVERQLLDGAVRSALAGETERLVAKGRAYVHADFASLMEWLATDLVIDFERCSDDLALAARDCPDFLWNIRDRVASRQLETVVPLNVGQKAFIIKNFSVHWPRCERTSGSSFGDRNEWDATEFLDGLISSIAGEPSPDATNALKDLAGKVDQSYSDAVMHALAGQLRHHRDQNYQPTTIEHLRSVSSGALPETIDDMRAYFRDRLEMTQKLMHSTNTDMWEAYWDGDRPRGENFCRNRLIEHIARNLPEQIRFEPEMHMPDQKRADIAAIRGGIGLPVEIKGQWHQEVWDAQTAQLQAKYARDWHAEGRGVYIVIWTGPVKDKMLPRHPDGLPRPATPEQLTSMLRDRMPADTRALTDIYVVDVTRLRDSAP